MGATISNGSSTQKKILAQNRQLSGPLQREGGLNAFYCYQSLVLDYVVVKAQQLFGSHGKMNYFCYRYPGFCLSVKSINSPMQHLQNMISFNFLYLEKMICPKL